MVKLLTLTELVDRVGIPIALVDADTTADHPLVLLGRIARTLK